MIKKPLVLVVDDEPPIVRLVQLQLETDDMRVRTAHRAEEALARQEEEPVDRGVVEGKVPGMAD